MNKYEQTSTTTLDLRFVIYKTRIKIPRLSSAALAISSSAGGGRSRAFWTSDIVCVRVVKPNWYLLQNDVPIA